MNPQSQTVNYGFHQHSFGQTMRFGGWHPCGFMKHGLQVALWMGMGFCLLLAYITW
jgi:hypothetical protein